MTTLDTIYRRQRLRRRWAVGECRCGRPLAPNRKSCAACLRRKRERDAARKDHS